MPWLFNHLWQSTLFAAAVACLCFALRHNQARTRYWLWLAASLKFLLPLSWVVAAGSLVAPPAMAPRLAPATVEQIVASFGPAALVLPPMPVSEPFPYLPWLLAVWLAGVLVVAARWTGQWLALSSVARQARRLPAAHLPVEVRTTFAAIEPGVFGVFKPVLLLPAELPQRLELSQLEAILAHELCHVRHCDNFTAALHMVVASLFWFHPLLWWIGARLVEEREKACDESVLSQGNDRADYAQGIVKVCQLYVASPLPCAAGVSGSDLRRRIVAILDSPLPSGLNRARKSLLVAAGLLVLGVPLSLGVLLRAQSAVERYRFEVASIRPTDPAAGNSSHVNTTQAGLTTRGTSLRQLIGYAYDIRDFQLLGAPNWIKESRYDIKAKFDQAEDGNIPPHELNRMESRNERIKARLRHLLAERFQLKLREETKELPVFALVVDKGGHKLKAVGTGSGSMNMNQNNATGTIHGDGVALNRLCTALAGMQGRPVVDRTGLADLFLIDLKWDNDTGPAVITALREQLGLRLDAATGPVVTYTVEGVERPTEN
jgi:bla regulator protein blaR1